MGIQKMSTFSDAQQMAPVIVLNYILEDDYYYYYCEEKGRPKIVTRGHILCYFCPWLY